MGEYTLLCILFAPFAGAIALIFVSNRQTMLVRGIAAGSAFVSLLASLYLFYAYDHVKGGFQFVQRFEWSRQLGISLHLGVDGIGTPLVLAFEARPSVTTNMSRRLARLFFSRW